jgi:hypothetical protein
MIVIKIRNIVKSKVWILNSTIAMIVLLFFIVVLSTSFLLTMVYLPLIGENFAIEALIAVALFSCVVTVVFSIMVLGSIYDKMHYALVAKLTSYDN